MSNRQIDIEVPDDVTRTIRDSALLAAGLGLVPAPLWDFAAVVGVQTSMMYKLCKQYNIEFSQERARSIVTSLIGSLTAASLATGVAGSMVKMLPIVGSFLGGINFSIWAGATTFAIGRVFANHLATGGNLLTFDTSAAREAFSDAFRKGKDFVARSRKQEEPA